jgi:hypothetical protein
MADWSLGTITRSGADGYFAEAKHIKHAIWSSYGTKDRDAAVALAERNIWRARGTNLDDVSAYTALDLVRHDYAVFEQALYLLQNSDAVSNGEQTGVKYPGLLEGTEPTNDIGRFGPEAQRWMGWNYGQIKIQRG